ncbi:MAG: class C sortase [Lachnospiraceae bacterium]|nr:class C sortase [Lachnospiraceae bacterium]
MRKKLGNIILVLILLVGVGLLVYPTFSDWWNSFHQTRAIAGYTAQVANMDKEDFDRMWAEAEAFNEYLKQKPGRFMLTDEEIDRYNSILDVTGTGIMGYIDIPSIKVSLPIYHGTDEAVLQIAIGHITGTSFPIGGEGTHCAVSGHRGLPSAKLFTDIDQLQAGDKFLLQILDRTLTYEVDQIRIVLPQELQDLEIDPYQDFCTLITCTPYGVNTHRLLVRGHRVDNDNTDASRVTADAMRFEPVIVAPLVAAPILFILLIYLLISTSKWNRRRKAHRSKDELQDAIGQIASEDVTAEDLMEGRVALPAVKPKKTRKPARPAKTAKPAGPDEPKAPDKPAESEMPAEPEKPETPEKATEPEAMKTPERPAETGEPENMETAETAGKPEKPEIAEKTEQPVKKKKKRIRIRFKK